MHPIDHRRDRLWSSSSVFEGSPRCFQVALLFPNETNDDARDLTLEVVVRYNARIWRENWSTRTKKKRFPGTKLMHEGHIKRKNENVISFCFTSVGKTAWFADMEWFHGS